MSYIYFDVDGRLREYVTTPKRKGSENVDTLFVYWEGNDGTTLLPSQCFIEYGHEKVHAGPLVADAISKTIIPFNRERDLKFFQYGKTYQFMCFNLPTAVSSTSGFWHSSVSIHDRLTNNVVQVLGDITFEVEESSIVPSGNLDLSQYNYLLDAIRENRIIYDSNGNVSAKFTDSGLQITGSSLTLNDGTWGFTKVSKKGADGTKRSVGMLLFNFLYDHGGYVDLGSAIFLTSERNVYALSDESIEYVKLSDGEIEVNATVADYLTKNRVDLSTIDDIFVPYTGANKDINIGNHSFTMGSVFTVGSENSVYTQTVPGSILLKNPIGTLGIGISSLTVNGTTIYWPTVSGDPNGKYFALRSDIPSIDDYLSPTSTNAVQNKVVNSTISELSYQLAMVRENLFQTVLSEIDYSEDFATLYPIPDTLSDTDGTHRVLFSETQLREVAGNSIAYNQNSKISRTPATIGGLTFATNDDGSLSVSGTSTGEENISIGDFAEVSGHKFLAKTDFITGKPTASSGYWIKWKSVGYGKDYGDGIIFTANGTGNAKVIFTVDSANTVVNSKLLIQLFDLTLMGLDSVSTVEEAKSELLKRGIDIDQYNPYSEGEIRNTTASGVKVNGYAPYKEPKAISFASTELLGAGEAHDTIEVVEKDKVAGIQRYNLVHVKRVGTVDLGTLSWVSYTGISDKYTYQAPLNDMKLNAGLTCSELVQVKAVYASGDDYSISSHPTLAKIYARTSNYEETETAFKTAMNGVILNYELATPTRTTIAENLTFEEVSATIEQGGSIETIYETLAPNCTTGFVVKKATEVSK